MMKRIKQAVRRAVMVGIGAGAVALSAATADAQVATPYFTTNIARKSTNVVQTGATSLAALNGNTNIYLWLTFNCATNTAAVGTNTIRLQGSSTGTATTSNWSTASLDPSRTVSFTNSGTNLQTQFYKIAVDPFTAIRYYSFENTDTNDTTVTIWFGQPNPSKQP